MTPLVDLVRQYESIQEQLDSAAINVLHSGQYILGNEVEKFEQEFAEYVGVRYAVGVGNGTDALIIALKASGVRPGDEVITAAMSFFSTAEAIAAIGAVPVFVDCRADTCVLDWEKLEDRITEKTKAIIPVHLYGQCADMDRINQIAEKYDLMVIEDAAQAAGATYKGRKAGSLGKAGCFSFFPTKSLGGAGDGGMVTTDDEAIYRQCLAYRVHGSGLNGLFAYGKEKNVVIDEKQQDFHGNLPKYYNYVIGWNSRLDALQAALLRVKLKYLDRWNETKRNYAAEYDSKIINPAVVKPICSKECGHSYYVYVCMVSDRCKFRAFLKERDIATGVYFPVALHLQKVFEELGYQEGDMPNAEYIAAHGVAIPMFAELTEKEIDNVIRIVNEYEE